MGLAIFKARLRTATGAQPSASVMEALGKASDVLSHEFKAIVMAFADDQHIAHQISFSKITPDVSTRLEIICFSYETSEGFEPLRENSLVVQEIKKELKKIVKLSRSTSEEMFLECEIRNDEEGIVLKKVISLSLQKAGSKTAFSFPARKLKAAAAMFILASLTAACGSDQFDPYAEKYNRPAHDVRFDPYVKILTKKFAEVGIDFDMKGVPIAYADAVGNKKAGVKRLAACSNRKGPLESRYLLVQQDIKKELESEPSTVADKERKEKAEQRFLQILAHEIGHCLVAESDNSDDGHVHDLRVMELEGTVKFEDGSKMMFGKPDRRGEIHVKVPVSMMYPYILPPEIYKAHEADYLKQLYNPEHRPANIISEDETFEGFKPTGDDDDAPNPRNMTVYIVKDLSGAVILKTTSQTEYLEALTNSMKIDINFGLKGGSVDDVNEADFDEISHDHG